MTVPNRKDLPTIHNSEQGVLNSSFDEDFGVSTAEGLSYDGQSLQRTNADNLAMKITEDGLVTYIAIAAPGTLQSEAKWQVKKIDKTTGTVITWADGNANFDNSATDLTALSYL